MNPCKHHSWIRPEIGDDALSCGRCGYRIPFEYIDLKRHSDLFHEYADRFASKGKMLPQEAVDETVYFDMHLTWAIDSWRQRMKQDDRGKSIIEAIDRRNEEILEKGREYQEAYEARISTSARESKADPPPEQPQISMEERTETDSDSRVGYLTITAGIVLIVLLSLLVGLC